MCIYYILEKIQNQKCQFARARNQGIRSVYDWRRTGVASARDCQEICLDWADGLCRSYTYDRSQNACYLSHVTSKTLKVPMAPGGKVQFHKDREPGMEMGDLDNCVNCTVHRRIHHKTIVVFSPNPFQIAVRLKCQTDGMLISGETMRMFSGTLHSRHKKGLKDRVCASVVTDAYNFNTKVMYDDCGTKKSVRRDSNLLIGGPLSIPSKYRSLLERIQIW